MSNPSSGIPADDQDSFRPTGRSNPSADDLDDPVPNPGPKPGTQTPAMVGRGGLEPPTSRLSGVRSNHLSYRPISGGA